MTAVGFEAERPPMLSHRPDARTAEQSHSS